MEWEIPVLNDLNMATFAGECVPGTKYGTSVGGFVNNVCKPNGSAAEQQCTTGSSPLK